MKGYDLPCKRSLIWFDSKSVEYEDQVDSNNEFSKLSQVRKQMNESPFPAYLEKRAIYTPTFLGPSRSIVRPTLRALPSRTLILVRRPDGSLSEYNAMHGRDHAIPLHHSYTQSRYAVIQKQIQKETMHPQTHAVETVLRLIRPDLYERKPSLQPFHNPTSFTLAR